MAEQAPRAGRHLSTVAPFGFTFDPERFLLAYKRLGCTGAQYYRNTASEPTVAQVLAVMERVGMRLDSIHGVFGSDIDPSSSDPAHRAACVAIYEREGRIALDLGAPVVVVHPAAHRPTTPEAPYDFPEYTPEEARRAQSARAPHLVDFLRRLADAGERLGVTYVIENMGLVVPIGHDAALLGSMIACVGSPRVRLCFDTGHAHFTGDVYESLRECAPVIGYIHMHDNDKRHDNHRMPGDGTIDWARLAAMLDEFDLHLPCMLEVFENEAEVERHGADGALARLLSPFAGA